MDDRAARAQIDNEALGRASAIDPYSPAQIARLVEAAGVRKVRLPPLDMFTLAVLAGAFIAFGGMFFTLAVTGAELGFGPTRVLGGLTFSLGLILVVIAGAELFTGNNLIVMAWAHGKVTATELATNWGIVFIGNFVGAAACVAFMYASDALSIGGGAQAETAIAIARAKVELDFTQSFVRGVLCNVLVCLAVWLSYASHRVAGKVLCILFPITAFVALGFEHSIANMYLIPIGMLASGQGIDLIALLGNLVPVTLGNIVGGSVLVTLVYWLVYLRGKPGPAH
ncbi:MAG: formate/nitrite transporter family protein [Gammaproteobacteria bacterium]